MITLANPSRKSGCTTTACGVGHTVAELAQAGSAVKPTRRIAGVILLSQRSLSNLSGFSQRTLRHARPRVCVGYKLRL